MIFTGNYSNCVDKSTVSISGDGGKSVDYTGKSYPKLAPKFSFGEMCIKKSSDFLEEDIKLYIHEYYNLVLKTLNPKEIYEELNNTILLCYEENTEFCCRHIVAAWLELSLKVAVYEVKLLEDGSSIILERPNYIKNILIEVMKED